MGYTTNFNGKLTLSKVLTDEQFNYFVKFSGSRRMKRDVNVLMERYKGIEGYPGTTIEHNTPEEIYGHDGEYFVGGEDFRGQSHDASIIDFNSPPGQLKYGDGDFETRWQENNRKILNGECQPSLWCQWIVEGYTQQSLEWDGGEKFYNYVEWLKYLINHFFSKWDVLLNGEIKWFGEVHDDMGKIIVKDNVVTIKIATISFD